MKSHDLEQELLQHQSQHRQQECLADSLHAGLHLPLADLIDAGDVVHDTLDAVQVALMDGDDAHVASRVPAREGRGRGAVSLEQWREQWLEQWTLRDTVAGPARG